ncbi:MAG: sensor histidine kinase [Lachnospiraceae bacterium]|nr:sensor histidine kinase [Lachnospiraceae bacterium]
MNIIKKYWESAYIYVLLLIPGMCMCAGTYWTVCKYMGLYPELKWIQILVFDCTQLIYLSVALFLIYKNKKDTSYISGHLNWVKGFITISLFVQYNFILYLFPSQYVWECTFIFLVCMALFFDSKLMLLNVILYFLSLLAAHLFRPAAFLALEDGRVIESIFWRIVLLVLTTICIMIVVYVVECFLIQAREREEENVHLLEKQLKYYREMELMDTEVRKFRHDIKNHFIGMEALLNAGNTEELKAYFEDLQASFSYPEKMFFTGNEVISAILHYDLHYYCKDEVEVNVYGDLPEIVTVSAMDLCTVFSNLLSNAITSANRCTDSLKPKIMIWFSAGNTFFSITIANSILQEAEEGQKKSKDRNHGYGIKRINEVLEKYGGRWEKSVEQKTMTIKIYLPI